MFSIQQTGTQCVLITTDSLRIYFLYYRYFKCKAAWVVCIDTACKWFRFAVI